MARDTTKAKGRSYGVILPWNFLEKYMDDMRKMPWPTRYGSSPQVLLFLREPLFQAISLLKKAKLFQMKRNDHVHCDNVNQRGGTSCPAAVGETIAPTFKELDEAFSK